MRKIDYTMYNRKKKRRQIYVDIDRMDAFYLFISPLFINLDILELLMRMHSRYNPLCNTITPYYKTADVKLYIF
jgi:hypothetical protein